MIGLIFGFVCGSFAGYFGRYWIKDQVEKLRDYIRAWRA